jgi:hypothetical protein
MLYKHMSWNERSQCESGDDVGKYLSGAEADCVDDRRSSGEREDRATADH